MEIGNQKIICLQAENIKKLKAIRIEPNGNLCVITGKNGAGKSSVLDCITYALFGKNAIDEMPIRNGEKNGRISIEMDDLIVTRTFTPSGGSLVVKAKNGERLPSPQSILDSLVSKMTDPLAFTRLKPSEQVEELKQLIGFDFSSLELEREHAYQERTAVNREINRIQALVDSKKPEVFINVPDEEIKATDLLNQLNDAMQAKMAIEVNERRRDELIERIGALSRQVEELRKKAAELDMQIKEAKLNTVDAEKIKSEIDNIQNINRQVRDKKLHINLVSELEKLKLKSVNLTKRIHGVEEKKEDALRNAKFPVSGLSFNSYGVVYNGVPFEQCSSGEKLRVSTAIGIARNPKFRVLIIRDGSLLDEENRKLIAHMAQENDMQFMIEATALNDSRPIDGFNNDAQVLIVDGEIRDFE